MSAEHVQHLLRALAVLEGVEPDSVLADYEKGGPLADLMTRFLGGQVTGKPKGRQPDIEENWRRFVAVVMAKRDLEAGTRTGRLFEVASEIDAEHGDGDPDGRMPEKFKKAYARAKQAPYHWTDDEVPNGLAAMYSHPPLRDRRHR